MLDVSVQDLTARMQPHQVATRSSAALQYRMVRLLVSVAAGRKPYDIVL